VEREVERREERSEGPSRERRTALARRRRLEGGTMEGPLSSSSRAEEGTALEEEEEDLPEEREVPVAPEGIGVEQ
jgi:hypothetical protein